MNGAEERDDRRYAYIDCHVCHGYGCTLCVGGTIRVDLDDLASAGEVRER